MVDMITEKVKINDDPSTLVHRIQELLKLNWQMHFKHIWWEGNMNANRLDNFSFSLDYFNVHVIEIW